MACVSAGSSLDGWLVNLFWFYPLTLEAGPRNLDRKWASAQLPLRVYTPVSIIISLRLLSLSKKKKKKSSSLTAAAAAVASFVRCQNSHFSNKKKKEKSSSDSHCWRMLDLVGVRIPWPAWPLWPSVTPYVCPVISWSAEVHARSTAGLEPVPRVLLQEMVAEGQLSLAPERRLLSLPCAPVGKKDFIFFFVLFF